MYDVIILLSTYNGQNYLSDQLDSLLNQIECNISILVRDDGSSDGTHSILEDYKTRGKLAWYRGKNLGAAHSFLDLIQHCSAHEFYALCDQDDIWDNDKVVTAINGIKENVVPSLYFSNTRLIDADDNFLHRNLFYRKPRINYESIICTGTVIGCTVLFNNELHQLLKKKVPQKIIMHDYYIAIVASLFGLIVYDHNSHMGYRQHGANVEGVSLGLKNKVKYNLNLLFKHRKVSISEQCNSILEIYSNLLTQNQIEFLNKVIEYKTSIIKTVQLSLSRRLRFSSMKNNLIFRIAILLRNR